MRGLSYLAAGGLPCFSLIILVTFKNRKKGYCGDVTVYGDSTPRLLGGKKR